MIFRAIIPIEALFILQNKHSTRLLNLDKGVVTISAIVGSMISGCRKWREMKLISSMGFVIG